MTRHLKSVAAWLLLLILGVGAVAASRWRLYRADGSSVEHRIASVLADRYALKVSPSRVAFAVLESESSQAVVLASRHGGPRDVYLVRLRLSRSGRILWMGDPVNLSNTPRLDESQFVVKRHRGGLLVAFPVVAGKMVSVVQVVDTAGEDAAATARWSALHRAAARITNWQETGSFAGIDRQTLEFVEPVQSVALSFDSSERLHIVARGPKGEQRLLYDSRRHRLVTQTKLVRHIPTIRGRRPLFNWLVDTVRSLSWVGPRKIALLEVAVFWLRDKVRRFGYRLRYGTASPPMRAEPDRTAQEMRRVAAAAPVRPAQRTTGWPPAPIRPVVADADPLEGRWLALPKDAIIRNPGAPEPMVQTFIHPDPSRPYSTVGILLWDPRQVELRLVAGTKEPVSSTGRRGTGRIPKDESMTRLLAAFNGGFQTLHGDFGMQTAGRLIREPARWAATVATYWDGSLAMGTWEKAPPEVPARIRDFRQNLAPLLEDDRENPLRSKYWGWAVRKYRERVYIVRSGLCQTVEGFGAYFWGKAVSLKSLTKAMKMARCRYGMQMDINFTNASLELYRIMHLDHMRPRPPRRFPVGGASRVVRGQVPGSHVHGFVARSWLPGMYRSPFPRYIRTNWRDFGLLYLRPVLPGSSAPGISWRTKGVVVGGDVFPPVGARATLPGGDDPNETVDVLKLDPAQLRLLASSQGAAAGQVVVALPPQRAAAQGPALAIERGTRGLVVRYLPANKAPGPDVMALLRGHDPADAGELASQRFVAGLGVSGEGFVCHAVVDGAAVTSLAETLERAGCTKVVLFAAPFKRGLLWLTGGTGVPSKRPAPAGWKVLRLGRLARPYWAKLFQKGSRPDKVRFGPTKGAYELIEYARTLRAQGINPSSREGRRLMRAKMFELSRIRLGKKARHGHKHHGSGQSR